MMLLNVLTAYTHRRTSQLEDEIVASRLMNSHVVLLERPNTEPIKRTPSSAGKRVLHIVENLNRGAVENWLLRMLKHARMRNIDVDWSFYCVLGQPGEMEQAARLLGARVIYSPVPLAAKMQFIRALRFELRRGNYNIVHCHHD